MTWRRSGPVRSLRRVRIALALLGSLLSLAAVYRLGEIGVFRSFPGDNQRRCQVHAGPSGPEDLVILHEAELLLASATPRPRRAAHDARTGPAGDLWVLDLSLQAPTFVALGCASPDPGSACRSAQPEQLTSFRPHGIDLYQDAAGRRTLFVVDHRDTGHHVTYFGLTIQDAQLVAEHQGHADIPATQLVSPNDVLALDHRRLIVSNDRAGYPADSLAALVESLLTRPTANLLYFDGERAHMIADQLQMANGLARLPNPPADWGGGPAIMVTESAGLRVRVYSAPSHDDLSARWIERQRLEVGTGVDNISANVAGGWRIAAHPDLFEFLRHSLGYADGAPSEVLGLRASASGELVADPQSLFLDDGSTISAASVAAEHRGHLFLGQVFGNGVLKCDAASR